MNYNLNINSERGYDKDVQGYVRQASIKHFRSYSVLFIKSKYFVRIVQPIFKKYLSLLVVLINIRTGINESNFAILANIEENQVKQMEAKILSKRSKVPQIFKCAQVLCFFIFLFFFLYRLAHCLIVLFFYQYCQLHFANFSVDQNYF